MKDVILSIDRGTTELKIMLIDFSGRCRGIERRKCVPLVTGNPDLIEADPEETYQSVAEATRSLLAKKQSEDLSVACISVTSYMSGTLFIDRHGEPIGSAVLWNDSRTKKLMGEWQQTGVLGRTFELTGSQILTGWPIPLLSWWKKSYPQVPDSAEYLLSMKDWIRYRLTGDICTDVTEAVLGPGDVGKRGYSEKILELYDVKEYARLFPPVHEPESIAGRLQPRAAKELGLPSGIPVVVGIGDMPAGILGTGALEKGHGTSVLGTTFLNGLVNDKPVFQPPDVGMNSAYVENRLLRLVNNTGGAAINYQWFLDNFYAQEKKTLSVRALYDAVDKIVEGVTPGSGGVIYHPYINSCGVTAPFLSIGARAQFFGIGMNTRKEDMLRAIYEGIGFAMLDCYSSVPVELVDITLAGGSSNSKVLCQIISDICGVKAFVPEEKDSTSLGASIVAAVGIGYYQSYIEAIEKMVRIECVYEPCLEKHEQYFKTYSLYRQIRNDMQSAWEMRRNL